MKSRMIKILVFLCVWIPLCRGHAHALTLGDIVVEVRRHVADRADPTFRYTDNYLIDLINQTQQETVNATWCLQTSTTQVLSTGTTYYSLPSNLLAIMQVQFTDRTGIAIDLEEVSERALRQSVPSYERQSGKPMQYFTRFPTDRSQPLQICYYPVPTATSTGTVRIQYYNQATYFTTTNAGFAEQPFDAYYILAPYQYALVWGTVAKIKLIEGRPEAALYEQMYEQNVTLMKDRIGRMPNYNPGFSGGSK